MEGDYEGERVNDMLGVVEGINDVMPCICIEQCDAQKRTLVEQVSKVRGTPRRISFVQAKRV